MQKKKKKSVKQSPFKEDYLEIILLTTHWRLDTVLTPTTSLDYLPSNIYKKKKMYVLYHGVIFCVPRAFEVF